MVLLHRYGNLCLMPRYSVPALAPLAPKGKRGHCACWRLLGAITGTSRGAPGLDHPAPGEPAWLGRPRGGLASSASRGLAPREGLECLLVKMGHAVGRRQASLGTPIPRTPTPRTRPMAWLHQWSSTARLRQLNTQDPREEDDTRPPQERPHQAGSRGGGEIKARGTS